MALEPSILKNQGLLSVLLSGYWGRDAFGEEKREVIQSELQFIFKRYAMRLFGLFFIFYKKDHLTEAEILMVSPLVAGWIAHATTFNVFSVFVQI